MSAAKGQYTAKTVTLVEGDIRTNRLTQDGRLMVDASGSGTAPAVLADATANPTTESQGAFIQGFNGTTWDRISTAVVTVSSTLTGMLNSLPWAIFHTSPATRTNNQGGPLEADATGNLRTVEQLAPVAEDNTAGVIKVEQRYSYTNITTGATTVVKSGAGFFHLLIVSKGVAAATITIYDNTAGSGTKIATITFGAALLSDPPDSTLFDVSFATGLTIVTSGATDITVAWR
jgi:hypothetical protein